ncbi:MAG: efflux RND transporter periplasmic adaptor subunit [Planctomycetes bacterium]|nr:efflux RND transporter periplasmic adaptor subunit [Planctomycetota bacterium]NBY03266.1 efflux RND transporter periplasmic adaptor subunit [Planctomycetota bacterium]
MEPGIVVKKTKALAVLFFLVESIPTLLVSAGLLGIGYWGASTEWTFKFPGSAESEAKSQEESKETETSLWKVEGGLDKANPYEKANLSAPSKEVLDLSELEFLKIESQTLIRTISGTGYVEFDSLRKGSISSKAPGVVYRILKKQGDKVLQGETIALIDSPEVGKAKTDFMQSLVLKDNRKKSLERGQLAAAVLPERQIRELEMAFREIEIKLLADLQALINLGFIINPADYKNLSDEDVFKRICEVGIPEAITKEYKGAISANLLPLKAPFDGQIITVIKGIGENVGPADAQCVLADPSRLVIMFNLPLESVQLVKVGQDFRFKAELVEGQVITGKIDWVSPELDDKTHTVKVRASFANPDGKIRPNTFGKGDIQVGKQENAVIIPDACIQYISNKPFVFVRVNDLTFQAKAVEMGIRNGDRIQITKGLLPGETVVFTGSNMLRAELLSKLEVQ